MRGSFRAKALDDGSLLIKQNSTPPSEVDDVLIQEEDSFLGLVR